MLEVLPDSRLKDLRLGSREVDWVQPNGTTIRLTLSPIFCFNCGKDAGWVPSDVMSHASFLCQRCTPQWGEYASKLMSPDQEFWDKVNQEMVARFGRTLTHDELVILGDQGRLGPSLEALAKDSPYRKGLPS